MRFFIQIGKQMQLQGENLRYTFVISPKAFDVGCP
jgi:hypothetical protein